MTKTLETFLVVALLFMTTKAYGLRCWGRGRRRLTRVLRRTETPLMPPLPTSYNSDGFYFSGAGGSGNDGGIQQINHELFLLCSLLLMISFVVFQAGAAISCLPGT